MANCCSVRPTHSRIQVSQTKAWQGVDPVAVSVPAPHVLFIGGDGESEFGRLRLAELDSGPVDGFNGLPGIVGAVELDEETVWRTADDFGPGAVAGHHRGLGRFVEDMVATTTGAEIHLAKEGECRVSQHGGIESGGHVVGAVQMFRWEFGGSAYPVGCLAQCHEQTGVIQEMSGGGAVGGNGETNQHAVTASEHLGQDQPTRPGLTRICE